MKIIARGGILFFLFVSIDSALATGATDSIRLQHIKVYDRQIFFGPVIKQRSISFQLKNRFDVHRIVYRPNNSYSAGVRFNLFGIGMEGTIAIPLATRNTDRFGSTDVTEFSFNSISKQWLADFYWQRYSGFYYVRSWEQLKLKDSRPLAPDLGVVNSGFSYTYIFNHRKFSIRSPYQFTEHQNRSNGSFLLGFVFSRFKVFNDTTIVLPSDQSYFGEGVNSNRLDVVNMSLMPGYSYTFVHQNYFLNLMLLTGLAHYWINYDPTNGPRRYDIDLNLATSFRAAVGYNGEKYFAGLSFSTQKHQTYYKETRFTQSVSSFRLVAGIRIREKGFFTKRPSDLMKQLKISQ